MELEFNIRGESIGRQRDVKPFNVLVLGNFSGNTALSGDVGETIGKRRIIQVDLDNVDEMWTVFAPRLDLQLGTASIEFTPRDIEDFHPDRLYRSLPVFSDAGDAGKTPGSGYGPFRTRRYPRIGCAH